MYISAVMKSGNWESPSRVSPTLPASEFSMGTIPSPSPRATAAMMLWMVGRRTISSFFRAIFRASSWEKVPFGPERDDGHRFTMHSIRASVIFCPSSQ